MAAKKQDLATLLADRKQADEMRADPAMMMQGSEGYGEHFSVPGVGFGPSGQREKMSGFPTDGAMALASIPGGPLAKLLEKVAPMAEGASRGFSGITKPVAGVEELAPELALSRMSKDPVSAENPAGVGPLRPLNERLDSWTYDYNDAPIGTKTVIEGAKVKDLGPLPPLEMHGAEELGEASHIGKTGADEELREMLKRLLSG